MITISIIVPIYQAELYLNQCLNSLVHQNLDNYEVICIDDGSTDSSASIIRTYKNQFPQIQYYYQANQGVSAARNRGIKEARGKYVMFVDADDWIRMNSLKSIYKKAERRKTDILVFGGSTDRQLLIPEWAKKALFTKNVFYQDNSCTALFHESGAKPTVWNKLFRHELIANHEFPEGITVSEDLAFLFGVYPHASKILFVTDNVYRYRISNTASVMHNTKNKSEVLLVNHLRTLNYVLSEWQRLEILEKNRTDLQEWAISFLDYIYVTLTESQKQKYENELKHVFGILNLSAGEAFYRISQLPQQEEFSLKKIRKSICYQFQKYGLYYGTVSLLAKIYARVKDRL